MPAYHYIAINATGQEKKGVIEAENEKAARQLLRDKSFVPLRIRPAQEKRSNEQTKSQFLFLQQHGLSSKELTLITRQLATLLAAGLPLEESLLAVAEQTEKQRIKGLILSVRGKVLEGHAFASSLREHPQAFSTLFCSTIAAGERTGHLDKVLLRLADYTEQQFTIQQKLKTASIYPAMIILVAFSIVSFLLEYVVPKMIGVYAHLNQKLPLLTEILIAMSNFIRSYGFYFLLCLLAVIYFWSRI